MGWTAEFISGTISGICGLISGYPFDTIKCRMQSFSNEYKTVFSSGTKIIKEEGILGIFKGISAPMLNSFPINAM